MANFLQESSDKFCYVYSCELDNPIRIKIGTLEGQIKKKDANAVISDPLLQFSGQYVSEYSDFYVQATVYANGKPLCLPVRTSYKPFTKRWNWNEWLQIPLRYKDLPRNAILGLTVYDIQGPREVTPVGGTTVSLFNRHSCLRRGFRDLRLWPETEADCSLQDSTPGLPVGQEGSEMDRLAKLVQQHRKGRMMPVDWLDRLTFREIEQVNEREKRESNYIFLTIEFPKFHVDTIEYNVIFFEPDGDLLDESLVASDYSVVQEPDKNLENLVESKHHKLSHSLRIGSGALELKPNPETKTRLQAIIQQPPTQSLNTDDKSLIWQFRYYLSLDKGALTKFLQCVDWGSNQESEEALDLLAKWQPLEPAAALELLTPKFQSPVHPRVRKYAMSRLQCADNEELLLYLLQLVQALRYETPSFSEQATSAFVPTLVADQVYSEATHTQLEAQLSDAFKEDDEEEKGFVSLSVRETNSDSDSDDGDESRRIGGLMSPDTPPVLGRDYINPLASFESSIISVDLSSSTLMSASVVEVEFPDLASFLIARACRSTRLANYFHWYVYVECQEDKDPASKEKYESIRSKFLDDLRNSPRPKWRKRYAMLIQQVELVDQLSGLMKTLLASKDDRIKKMEKLQSIIKGDVGLVRFKQPIRLPVDPHIQATGIIPSEATLFKSALMPARFNFKVESGEKYSVMFKVGDDLRQDQLILQMIMLIDRLLRRENLDLKLTPYKVLACSGTLGFVQLIQRSDTVAHILATHKSIQAYFRAHGSSDKGAYGISPEIMDTYIKSCAGYSVITYLLSVGDRHLDNLLLMETGNLIHIDFGYILGRDPKIFPPPMRLSKEMVDAMGGTSSKEFSQFREHCYNAFLTLRRSANLFLNLFSLMLDSGVPDIALEPDKTVQKVEDKFRLDLSDEEAVKYLQGLIDLSIRAIFPELFEKIHKIAQDFRK